jgi:two-component sensor histidine kinase
VQKLRNSVCKLSLFFLTIFIFGQQLSAQEIQGPKFIIREFSAALDAAKVQKGDSISVYAIYLKRLIDRGNFIQADSIFNSASAGFSNNSDSTAVAGIYKDRAYMYKVQRRFDKSLEDYLWLKSYYERNDSVQGLIEVYSLLAEYYRAIARHELSDSHLKIAESLIRKSGTSNELLAYWYSRKAAWSNESLGNNDSIIYYANEGLKLVSDTVGIHTKALLLNEIGFLSMNSLLDKDTIFYYFNMSKDLLYQNERYRDYVEVVNNMAIYNYRYGSMPEAIGLMESIVQIEEDNGWYAPLEVTYKYLDGLYRDTGQQEKSAEMHEKAWETTIKNLQSGHTIQVSDLAITYEKDLAEKELEVQEQKTAVAESNAKSNKRAFSITAIIAGFLLIISVIVFQFNIRFRKKNEELGHQRDQIQQSNNDLEKSLSQQQILFKELNHRVKNNLSILTGLIYLQEIGESDLEHKETLSTLRNRIKSMAMAHESLYNSGEAKKIGFQKYLFELFRELGLALTDSERIATQIECEGFELELRQAVPLAMIINELFTNSIKHGFKNVDTGTIKVEAYHEKDHSIVKYTDDGVGFSIEQKGKRTLGLRLIKLLLEQLDATMTDESGETGVHFIFKIPSESLQRGDVR